MIDIRKLKELVKLMVENDLAELDLRDQEEKVTIRRGGGPPVIYSSPAAYERMPGAAANGQADATPAEPAADDGLIAIESPMVGTFYSAANPDSEPFVSVGASISEGSVVCIVEAMKVFNEIKADLSGTVERVCVKNGEAVEFGQTLFLVRPN